MQDFTYTQTTKSMVTFLPNTPQGEQAWREIATQNNGHMNFFNFEKQNVINQLKRAGYTVAKAKPSKITVDEIFKLMDELGV